MSGNLAGTYQSFLTRCLGGVRWEQEAFRELPEAQKQLEALDRKGKSLDLPEGWMVEGTEEPVESYRKGKEAFEKEGDVYALLEAGRDLARHCEGTLKRVAEELRRKREQEEAAEELRRQEEAKRRKRQQEEEERRKREQEEAEERERIRQAETKEVMKGFFVVGMVALVVGLFGYMRMENKRRQKSIAKAKAEIAAMPAGKTVGETKTITLPGGATMEMVWCPPGTFTMGSPSGEVGRNSDETQHKVTLTTGFWMAKTEVTQAQWKSVMGTNPSYNKGDDLPVEKVSWDDCQKFCEKTGLQLPTEAQWEYACRAGNTGPYAGTGFLDELGWYGVNSDGKTHPVAQKQPNAWGFYDMHGNVLEWCEDWFGDYPNGAVTDPKGSYSRSSHVLRGGSWVSYASHCRSASRGAYYQSGIYGYSEGFRPVSVQSE
jgi:formylglycine-generating enzyme required for sulfatase activity